MARELEHNWAAHYPEDEGDGQWDKLFTGYEKQCPKMTKPGKSHFASAIRHAKRSSVGPSKLPADPYTEFEEESASIMCECFKDVCGSEDGWPPADLN